MSELVLVITILVILLVVTYNGLPMRGHSCSLNRMFSEILCKTGTLCVRDIVNCNKELATVSKKVATIAWLQSTMLLTAHVACQAPPCGTTHDALLFLLGRCLGTRLFKLKIFCQVMPIHCTSGESFFPKWDFIS